MSNPVFQSESHRSIRLMGIPVAILATLSLLYFGAAAPALIPLTLVQNPFIDDRLKYQLVTLALAILVLLISYALSPISFKRFFRFGNLNAPAAPLKWLGIGPGERWGKTGSSFAIIVSLVTAVFIYFTLAAGQTLEPAHLRYLPFIFLLAASNAFVEEAITRLSVVVSLDGIVKPATIFWASALIFGIPHFFGVPGGIPGSLMAGFLGWLLAKSIVETEGIFWAWFIHFLQDVIIFGALFLVYL